MAPFRVNRSGGDRRPLSFIAILQAAILSSGTASAGRKESNGAIPG